MFPNFVSYWEDSEDVEHEMKDNIYFPLYAHSNETYTVTKHDDASTSVFQTLLRDFPQVTSLKFKLYHFTLKPLVKYE